MQKNKIAVIVKFFWPVAAGIEQNIMQTYSVLQKKGWDITIHTSRDTYLERNSLPVTETINGLKVKRYSYKNGYFLPDINWEDVNLICLHNFDMVLFFIILLKIAKEKIINKRRFKVVLTPHGGYNPEWRVFSRAEGLVKAAYTYTLGTFLINNLVDRVRAVSVWEKVEMIKRGLVDKRVEVISNGVEDISLENPDPKATKEIKQTAKKFGRYLIQIGRVYPIKNYETTIKALSLLPKDIHYLIVGPIQDTSGYKESLDKLISDLNLSNRVHFLGVVRSYDKFYLIKHSQMMVHMAIWESYCNVVHEAMSQGKPCLVADNTALPFLIKNGVNGYCIDAFDHKELAKRINFLLDPKNKSVAEKMAKENITYSKLSTWTNVAAKMDKMYLSLIRKN